MEQRRGCHALSVSVRGQEEVYDGTLRGSGAAATRHHEQHTAFPQHTVARRGSSPRGGHRETGRSVAVKVRLRYKHECVRILLLLRPHRSALFRRTERSTDQVIKPINLEALTRWVGHIPADVQEDMENIAPMLRRLGYNPNANPPDYGQPEPEVINNTQRVYIFIFIYINDMFCV